MDISRLGFIKGICATVATASLPAQKCLAENVPDVSGLEFVYAGIPRDWGMKLSKIDFSYPLKYKDVVRHTAMEIFRFRGVKNEGLPQYLHSVGVYRNGCAEESIIVGVDNGIDKIGSEDSELTSMMKCDVEKALNEIKVKI